MKKKVLAVVRDSLIQCLKILDEKYALNSLEVYSRSTAQYGDLHITTPCILCNYLDVCEKRINVCVSQRFRSERFIKERQ